MYWQISVTIMSFGDQGGVTRMDPKLVYCSYDSQRSVHLHRIDKVRWSSRLCKRPRKCCKFSKKILSFYLNPNLCDSISEATWTWQSYPLHFSVDFKEIKTISPSLHHARDLFTTAAERPSQRRDWNASAIWNRGFWNTNLEIFFPRCMAYQTGTYEMTHKSAQS